MLGFLVRLTGLGSSGAGEEQAVLALGGCAMPGLEEGMLIRANSAAGAAASEAELFPGRGSICLASSGGALEESWSLPIPCLTGGSFALGGIPADGSRPSFLQIGWSGMQPACNATYPCAPKLQPGVRVGEKWVLLAPSLLKMGVEGWFTSWL